MSVEVVCEPPLFSVVIVPQVSPDAARETLCAELAKLPGAAMASGVSVVYREGATVAAAECSSLPAFGVVAAPPSLAEMLASDAALPSVESDAIGSVDVTDVVAKMSARKPR